MRTLRDKKLNHSPEEIENELYATSGPLTRIFLNPVARVLDQSMIVGRMEQSISMLMESTNLSYKTVEKTVRRLIHLGLMEEARKIGNARTFRFRVDNHLSELIACAQKIQIEEIKMETESH
jgi:hypothetical protein